MEPIRVIEGIGAQENNLAPGVGGVIEVGMVAGEIIIRVRCKMCPTKLGKGEMTLIASGLREYLDRMTRTRKVVVGENRTIIVIDLMSAARIGKRGINPMPGIRAMVGSAEERRRIGQEPNPKCPPPLTLPQRAL